MWLGGMEGGTRISQIDTDFLRFKQRSLSLRLMKNKVRRIQIREILETCVKL